MIPDYHWLFIKSKIGELGSAILHTYNEGTPGTTSCIAKNISTSELGHIWFTMRRPRVPVDEEKASFSARIRFYKKGVPFYVEGSGKVVIEKNETGEPDEVVARLLLSEVEYTDISYHKIKWQEQLSNVYNNVYNWVLNHISIPYRKRTVTNNTFKFPGQ